MSNHESIVLSAQGLTAGYGRGTVLHGINFELREGEVVAILGSNGAGKTTFVRTLAGQLKARAGDITLLGRPVARSSVRNRVRSGLIVVPEGRRLFQRLTVAENIALGTRQGKRRPGGGELLELVLSTLPDLSRLWKTRAGLLSGGQQQMVAIARGAAANPRVLLLDEPTLGLSPKLSDEVLDLVAVLGQVRSLSVVLVEQQADRALAISDRGYVIDRGTVAITGPSAVLLADDAVRSAYLGL
ncbi:ABC transporter ATP-binding protein [Arthrobacter sp. ISL-28]|uniref:ABC transporter ATP-binding protein n=1 Tax=Arthrobacter sp. ISL-28 TaxID=2819108 RepID=UPI001BEB1272|nr:ABC transporter ATP-binding protein [Arthrobacter sp. ISL-28]MBT2523312.1 ABC transporter ATP-binding protein [Arthrobacter sp. ISL-28]